MDTFEKAQRDSRDAEGRDSQSSMYLKKKSGIPHQNVALAKISVCEVNFITWSSFSTAGAKFMDEDCELFTGFYSSHF